MNTQTLTLALSAALLTSGANLANAQARDNARVVSVTPVTERHYSTEEVCWERGRRNRNHDGAAIAGALIGGLLGNQVGSGDGRKAATVAGAVVGAVAGRNISKSQRSRYECEDQTVYVDEIEYQTQYRYNGRIYTATLPYEPGRSIPVYVYTDRGQVEVRPIMDYRGYDDRYPRRYSGR